MSKTFTHEEVINHIKNAPGEKIKVAVTDIDGILRGKYINKNKFLSSVEKGFGFCSVIFGWDSNDSCYDNSKISGWHNGYPDVNAKIDLSTFRKIPWENETPFFLADFIDEHNKPLFACPRQLLKKIIAKASSLDLAASFGLEFEWFNFKEDSQSLQDKHFNNLNPLTPGMFGYSIIRSSQNKLFLNALLDDLLQFGIPLEGLHTETGPGVLEGAILYSDALEAADRGVLFKNSVKEIAHRFDIMPSFMARWSNELPGCGGHLHQSMWDMGQQRNLFFDEKDSNHMSELFKHYLAGQQTLLPELLPFFAPNVNSFKRLVEGFWAPTKSTWGVDNRTTAFRVIKGGASSTRLETRVPGSDMNSYLAVAAALGAGLYGIENKIPLDAKAVIGNSYL
ncbi:MAG: glutamine synthetase family protein, partial [bacterium]|nr:glutamine synthetase family protein [bacterium]